jgi:hypothetical protein
MNKKLFSGPILEIVLLNLINTESDRGLNCYVIFKAMHKKFSIRLGTSTPSDENDNL